MTVTDIVLCNGATSFAVGGAVAAWRTWPEPADIEPDMKLVAKFIASTPREELRRIVRSKA